MNSGHSRPDDLASHARLGGVDQSFFAQRINFHAQLVLHKLYRLLARESVPSYYGRWVYFLLDELVCLPQKLRSDNDDRGRAISDLLVLLLCKVHEDASSWMLHS